MTHKLRQGSNNLKHSSTVNWSVCATHQGEKGGERRRSSNSKLDLSKDSSWAVRSRGMGKDRSMKGSRVVLWCWHVSQVTVEESWPANTSARNPAGGAAGAWPFWLASGSSCIEVTG